MKYFEIEAFFPCYSADGSVKTCILLHDGTKQYTHYELRQFVSHLLCEIGLDYRSIRLWSTKVTGIKHQVPLIIDTQNVFLPVKLQKEGTMNEVSYGYIHTGSIVSYTDSEIVLKSQTILPTLSSSSYIDKKMVSAKLLLYAYLDHKKQYEFMWKE